MRNIVICGKQLKKFGPLFLFLFILVKGVAQENQKSLFRLAVELSNSKHDVGNENTPYKFRFDNSDSTVLMNLAAFLEIEETNSDEIQIAICEALSDNPFFSCSNLKQAPIHIPEELSSPNSTRKDLSDTEFLYNQEIREPSIPRTSSLFTTAVDGFSRWLVKRTKQELSLVFFDKFKAAINKEQYLNTLFPTTVSLLNVVDTDGYHSGYLRTLQESFFTDFQQLPYQMPVWARNTELIESENERFLITETMKVVPTIIDGNEPSVILDHLSNIENVPDKYADVFGAFKLSRIILNTLKSGKDSWEPVSFWENNIKEDFVFYAYMGLLWHQGHKLNFQNEKIKTDFHQIGNKLSAGNFELQKDTIKNVVKNFLTYSKRTASLVKELADKKLKNDTSVNENQAFYFYSNSVIEFLKASDDFRVHLIGGSPSEIFNQSISVLQSANNMVFNIRDNKYLLGVSNLNEVLKSAYTLSRPSLTPEVIESGYEEFHSGYFKYVTFMATVADARNAREVEFAFDMFALPAGSSRLKKNSQFSLGINSYVGPTVGREVLEVAEENTIVALAAPVGLSINRGYGRKGSWSLFVPIIDLGAVTAYRFGDDIGRLPELTFNNIIAPGFYGVYGFGKDIPLSIGAGAQLGPNLRKVTRASAEIEDRGWRYGIFMAVDIPVFHFYTK